MGNPLDGVKVANFCWILAGPMTIRYLAAWGATVVRVESHRRPDVTRMVFPYQNGVPHIENSPYFANTNISNYSLSIDLNQPSGLNIAWKLIEWADVVAENFIPGIMARFGLDYESVRKKRPDIVYFSSGMMGSQGPLAKFAGYGYHTTCLSGVTHLTGWQDRQPVSFPGAYTDFISPRFGAAAILAALDYRKRTGKGQFIDLSQLESGCLMIGPALMKYAVDKVETLRDGNHAPFACPHNVYPCKGDDEWCAIAVYDDEQWAHFLKASNNEAWAEDSRFNSLSDRKTHERELDTLISAWTSERSALETEDLLQASGVPASRVATIPDIHADPQLWHNRLFRVMNHGYIGPHIYRGPAFRFSRSEDSVSPGPCLGEHNELVLRDFLGLSDEEIADALVEGGITNDGDLPTIRSSL